VTRGHTGHDCNADVHISYRLAGELSRACPGPLGGAATHLFNGYRSTDVSVSTFTGVWTSCRNWVTYKATEECSSHLVGGGSLKSRKAREFSVAPVCLVVFWASRILVVSGFLLQGQRGRDAFRC
jgi:hypothetical protein